MWVSILKFAAVWNMQTNKGTVLMESSEKKRYTLNDLSMQKFTMLTTLLEGAHAIQLHTTQGHIKAGEAEIDG